ncbi:MAG TPA: hypothetical protein VFZ65_02190 [Planctomycetota bacterium]|nr:hypothetical protein [Planctomycetota bacterium]
MNDPRAEIADDRQAPNGGDSQQPATRASRKDALLDGSGRPQNALDVRAAVPLHVRPVLNGYREVAELGICSERALRRHIATGRVKRSVIRNGRNLRFVKDALIDELRGAED